MKAGRAALPIAPTRTQFCSAEIDVGPGLRLFVDGNSKITRENGTFAAPMPNALSLPAASVSGDRHCPGSTKACRSSCYVTGLAQHAPDLYARYVENARALDEILAPGGPFVGTAHALARWIREHAPGGFRWHVSGDVRGIRHAGWILAVCLSAPDVPFWIYTRTLEAVPALREAPNLAVNVSADRDNYVAARGVALDHGARLCYLVHEAYADLWGKCWRLGCPTCTGVPEDLPPGSVIFPDYALRGRDLEDPTSAPWWQALTDAQRRMVCGADFFGQSQQQRCGPCRKCL